MKLNLGCGSGKIEGFINVDIDPLMEPDLVADITKSLPYNSGSVSEIVMFHAIEHLRKELHVRIYMEMYRILEPGGKFILSYPEFTKCYHNWKTNFRGQKNFWEATIYGAQRSASDYHVAIMHTPDVIRTLVDVGFEILSHGPEKDELFNTVIKVTKRGKLTYEEALVHSCQPVLV